MTNDRANVINSLSSDLSEKEKREIRQAYQNGYYSLLLNYNDELLSAGNYYWWYQTNNIANKETIKGFYKDFLNGNASNGLTYNKNGDYWVSIKNQSTNLGVKTGDIKDFSGINADSVDLYVDAREYICKYTLTNVTYNGVNIKDLTLADGSKICN